MAESNRGSFGSKIGMILATAGGAVGLGNVWRFPYMAGQEGGAAFILVYIGSVLLLGIPCMISEFIIGRQTCVKFRDGLAYEANHALVGVGSALVDLDA